MKRQQSFLCGGCGTLMELDQETLIRTIDAAVHRMRAQIQGNKH